MNAKQLIALSVFAFAGSAALADDITLVNQSFAATRSRAEVKAEVLQARAAGVAQFATEMDAIVSPAMPAVRSTLTREQVRAELRKTPRVQDVATNPAA